MAQVLARRAVAAGLLAAVAAISGQRGGCGVRLRRQRLPLRWRRRCSVEAAGGLLAAAAAVSGQRGGIVRLRRLRRAASGGEDGGSGAALLRWRGRSRAARWRLACWRHRRLAASAAAWRAARGVGGGGCSCSGQGQTRRRGARRRRRRPAASASSLPSSSLPPAPGGDNTHTLECATQRHRHFHCRFTTKDFLLFCHASTEKRKGQKMFSLGDERPTQTF